MRHTSVSGSYAGSLKRQADWRSHYLVVVVMPCEPSAVETSCFLPPRSGRVLRCSAAPVLFLGRSRYRSTSIKIAIIRFTQRSRRCAEKRDRGLESCRQCLETMSVLDNRTPVLQRPPPFRQSQKQDLLRSPATCFRLLNELRVWSVIRQRTQLVGTSLKGLDGCR